MATIQSGRFKVFLVALLISITGNGSVSAATLDFAVLADAGEWNASAQMSRDSLAKTSIRSLILPGDNLYTSTYKKVWSNWASSGFLFDVVAIGNHNGGYSKEIGFFAMPGEYYSKVYPGVARFIVLNSDNVATSAEQAKFLEMEFSRASEPFVFLVYHHPSYTLSHFHRWEEKRDFHLAIRPVIWRYRAKLTALLLGHDHLALLAHYNDLPVIISGAAKEQRVDTPVNNLQDDVRVSTDWFFDRNAYWARLHLDTTLNIAQVGFIRSRDQKEMCTASIAPGRSAMLSSNCAAR